MKEGGNIHAGFLTASSFESSQYGIRQIAIVLFHTYLSSLVCRIQSVKIEES